MSEDREHYYIPRLRARLAEGRIGRRDFLRCATLLGLSSAAAYGFVGKIAGRRFIPAAEAARPRGGRARIAMRVLDVSSPHTYAWITDSNIGRQVHEYLTQTGADNVTRPLLAESWSASDDLRTWTLKIRNVKWRSGRPFTAEDVEWNLRRVLDESTKSSVIGLMKGYMLTEEETGGENGDGSPRTRNVLWDANAIEVVDSSTIRLNLKTSQLAVPEHLFHYPLPMLDPDEGGRFGVGSNGTGAFELVEHAVGERSLLRARKGYWGKGPYLDEIEFLDLGDSPSAAIDALERKRVDGLYEADVGQLDRIGRLPHVRVYEATTANTAVARFRVDRDEFKDPRVRLAVRLATDSKAVLATAHRNIGTPGEHHHVCPVHPDYAELPFMEQDVEAAKRLLSEAGHPDGIDLEIACKKEPAWEYGAVQVMADQWKAANIRCKVDLMPSERFYEVWDKVPFGFTQWAHRPLGFMALGLAYRSGVPWNESRFANPEFDRLLARAEGTLDLEERRSIMARLQEIMQEEGPIVQPLWRGTATAYDKRIHGAEKHPTNYIFGNELAMEQ